MAVRGYFYNATGPNDAERMYNGEDMNRDKAPFYKEGVVFGHLQVTAEGGTMTVNVDGGAKTGYAYINLHTIHNTTVLPLQIGQANGILPRIDRVVIRNDEAERKPSIIVLEGAYSTEPQPPELTNNDTIQEKSLARIYVAAGAVEITQADITDERADESVCGFIASQFQDIDFSQFQSQFNAWFERERENFTEDHAAFIEEYATLTQAFMNGRAAEFDAWFNEKKGMLEGDVAATLLEKVQQLENGELAAGNSLKLGGKEADKYAEKEHSHSAADVGLDKVPNVATNDQTPTFEEASSRTNIASGEKVSVIFGKIMKFFADLKAVAFSGSYNDLSNKPSIPAAVRVKGSAETTYRTGDVNITAANIGLDNVNNTADANKNVASAVKATQDGNGNNIVDTYATKASLGTQVTFTLNGTHLSITTK